ncbi:unnamed protein product [Nippostrongylus brasiliensis]|uniref:Curli production assembly/transport component CsgG n=1 Tax=Nippostrongylus brasiliensis TaxID=27835 RepID=A0A0N4YPV4_NIPBR|nr:unnamed protein product [Nippostrongylus brasiliensis]
MRRCYASCCLAAVVLLNVDAQFNIPIPFGNIGLNKGKDGEVCDRIPPSLFSSSFGKKAVLPFLMLQEDKALVNGTEYGGSGAFGFDKQKGINVGQNVTLGDMTVVGGPGRESNFIADLLATLRQLFGKNPP